MDNDIFIKLNQQKKEVKPRDTIKMDYENVNKSDFENAKNKMKILEDIELAKCLMILAIKKYTWRNELMIHFGLTHHKVDKFKEIMTEMGYMAHKLIWEIPDDVAYMTMKTQANMVDQAQMFALTPAGERWAKEAINFIAIESNKNENLMHALNYVLERTKAFKKKYAEIHKLEYERSNRYVTHVTKEGTYIEDRTTLLGKTLKNDMKIAMAELKLEKLEPEKRALLLAKAGILLLEDHSNKQITLNYSQALMILKEKEPKKEKKNQTNYNQYFEYGEKLSNLKALKLSEGVTEEETKREKKEGYVGATNEEELITLNEMWKGLTCKKDKINAKVEKQKQTNKDIFDILGISNKS